MLDIAAELHRWVEQGRSVAVATVVATSGSAPRQPGAALAVDSAGNALGSVSGGCVEAAVYELCRQALQDGRTVLERFGYEGPDGALAAGDPFAPVLTCGGTIDVLVSPLTPGVPGYAAGAAALGAAARGERTAHVRVVDGPPPLRERALRVRADGTYEGGLGGAAALDATAAAEALALLDAGRTGTVTLGAEGSRCGRPVTLFVESSVPPPRMIVFGAIDFAAALVDVGTFLGYRVTVCDARPVFATAERFPGADEVVVDWPHRYLESTETDVRTVLCVLTHDARFDIPLLCRALRTPVAYVGAMGSRRTHEDRVLRLREAGLGDRELSRLRSPIGLDLGARTPQETALSIAAEIVAHRRGGSGVPLTGTTVPIHRDAPVGSAA